MSCFICTSRKVTFNNIVKVNYYEQTLMEPDVCWQQIARDRLRFRKRIKDSEIHIGLVLASNHRKSVYNLLTKRHLPFKCYFDIAYLLVNINLTIA